MSQVHSLLRSWVQDTSRDSGASTERESSRAALWSLSVGGNSQPGCFFLPRLAQSRQQQQNVEDAMKEMQKPLARYIDDEDLDRMLREQEREGEGMAFSDHFVWQDLLLLTSTEAALALASLPWASLACLRWSSVVYTAQPLQHHTGWLLVCLPW